jgi:hypothetical protein
MATQYDKPSQALSSLVQTTGLSSQGSKGWLFIKNNPERPCFDLRNDAKEEHFSDELVEFLVLVQVVQHYAKTVTHGFDWQRMSGD